MKFLQVASIVFSIGAASAGVLQGRATRSCADPTIVVPMYRFYNQQTTAHILTADTAEKGRLEASGTWGYDGIAAYIWTSKEPETVAIYRLRKNDNTDYFYTTSVTEKNQYVKSRGFTEEGISGYIYPDNVCGAKPFYRLYRSDVTDHFYTADKAKKADLVQYQYADEGNLGWVAPSVSC